MVATVVALIIIIITLLWAWLKYRVTYWKRRDVPHIAPSSVILGNVAEFPKTKHISQILRKTYDTFKGKGIPFAGFYFGSKISIVVLDLNLAKNILIKDFQKFRGRGIFNNERDDPLTGNLFFLDGEKWARLRHKISPTFTSGKMKLMYASVVNAANELVDVLSATLKNATATVDVEDFVSRYTADVIGCCAFGLKCNCLRNPDSDFIRLGRLVMRKPRHSAIVDGLIHSFPNVARKLRMRIFDQEVHDYYMNMVRETVAYREQHNAKYNDFMDLLIELKNDSSDEHDCLTIGEIAAQATVFFVGGFDTSSTTMSFALYELAQNQHIQDKVRQEIDIVMDSLDDDMLTYDSMKDLPYLQQVIDETLRMHPIAPQLIREAGERYDIDDPKYYIEKGTFIAIPVMAYHHDPEIYPNPEEFQPDRFSPDMVKGRHICAYLPFGEGPRNCIGLRFAKMQVLTGLAYLLRKFRFDLAPETEVPYKLMNKNMLLSPLNGVKLTVKQIRK